MRHNSVACAPATLLMNGSAMQMKPSASDSALPSPLPLLLSSPKRVQPLPQTFLKGGGGGGDEGCCELRS